MTHRRTEPKKTVYRDSVSGEFKPRSYAEKHPSTTEKERVRVHPPAPPKHDKDKK